MIPFEREVDGRQLVANACGKGRLLTHEEGAVGTIGCDATLHLVGAETERKLLIEHLYHIRRIATTTPKSGTRRDALVKVDVNRRKVKFLLQIVVNAYDEVAFRVALNLIAREEQAVRCVLLIKALDFKVIVQGDGVKHGGKVVITILALA